MSDFERLSKWVTSIFDIDIKDATLSQINVAIQNICEEDDIELSEDEFFIY